MGPLGEKTGTCNDAILIVFESIFSNYCNSNDVILITSLFTVEKIDLENSINKHSRNLIFFFKTESLYYL